MERFENAGDTGDVATAVYADPGAKCNPHPAPHSACETGKNMVLVRSPVAVIHRNFTGVRLPQEETNRMMQTLKIEMYKPQKNDPESRIRIPLSSLSISEKLLPARARAALQREGIDLSELGTLFAKQGPKGTLIEIENADERLVISIE